MPLGGFNQEVNTPAERMLPLSLEGRGVRDIEARRWRAA